MKKIKAGPRFYAPDEIITHSDRQYRVGRDGAWRRLRGKEVVAVYVDSAPVNPPLCRDGRNLRLGNRCYCKECIEQRRRV